MNVVVDLDAMRMYAGKEVAVIHNKRWVRTHLLLEVTTSIHPTATRWVPVFNDGRGAYRVREGWEESPRTAWEGTQALYATLLDELAKENPAS
jgi:hypothetical protein